MSHHNLYGPMPKLEGLTTWEDGLDRIAKARSDKRAQLEQSVERTFRHAKAQLVQAEELYQRRKARHGERSGHKKLTAAKHGLERAQRRYRNQLKELEYVADRLPVVIDEERRLLDKAVRRYLDGLMPASVGQSIRMRVVVDGSLHIFFNKDYRKVHERRSDGHFVVLPSGYMGKMRLR